MSITGERPRATRSGIAVHGSRSRFRPAACLHSIPCRSIPFHSGPVHSRPFHSIPCQAGPFQASPFISGAWVRIQVRSRWVQPGRRIRPRRSSRPSTSGAARRGLRAPAPSPARTFRPSAMLFLLRFAPDPKVRPGQLRVHVADSGARVAADQRLDLITSAPCRPGSWSPAITIMRKSTADAVQRIGCAGGPSLMLRKSRPEGLQHVLAACHRNRFHGDIPRSPCRNPPSSSRVPVPSSPEPAGMVTEIARIMKGNFAAETSSAPSASFFALSRSSRRTRTMPASGIGAPPRTVGMVAARPRGPPQPPGRAYRSGRS